MKIARVVGNLVSTVKDKCFQGYKLMLVEYLDPCGIDPCGIDPCGIDPCGMNPDGTRQIAFDAAHAGVGDIVLVSTDGGAANIITGDAALVADLTICGVLDSFTINGKQTIVEHGKRMK